MSFEFAPHKTVIDEYKGNPLFKIIKIDEEGNEVEKFSTVVSFGATKARYILENIDEIKKFIEELDKSSTDS